MIRLRMVCLGLLLILLITACQGRGDEPTPTAEIFRPPTPVTTPSPETQPKGESDTDPDSLRPTPTPSCQDSLRFLGDLTIPDGTIVNPGDQLDKRWQVENNGTCNWDQNYQVRLIAGTNMGVASEQALYPALPGSVFTIRMIYSAPTEPGTYRSAWQAHDPHGEAFGDPFYIEIVVANLPPPL
jgi:hypothetical protein